MTDSRFLAYAFFVAFTLVWVSRSQRVPRRWRALGVVGLFAIIATTVQVREGAINWPMWGLAVVCALVSLALAPHAPTRQSA
jgi:peptidoglycan/LPS O-acetylase OafA/YrhL